MTPPTLSSLSGLTMCVALLAVPTAAVRAQSLKAVQPPGRDVGVTVMTARAAERGLPAYQDATDLVAVGRDNAGRPQWLRRDASAAWFQMRRAAEADGVMLLLISGFRSVDQQRHVFERKLRAGQTLGDILAVNVPPGFSEHHSGTAIDVGTPGSTALLEDFEQTPAFRWLEARAAAYGFSLSYPRGNPAGLAYEPWHWRLGRERDRFSQ